MANPDDCVTPLQSYSNAGMSFTGLYHHGTMEIPRHSFILKLVPDHHWGLIIGCHEYCMGCSAVKLRPFRSGSRVHGWRLIEGRIGNKVQYGPAMMQSISFKYSLKTSIDFLPWRSGMGCLFEFKMPTYDVMTRADSRFAPSQWETALLCNDISHWLGASLESAWMTAWHEDSLHIIGPLWLVSTGYWWIPLTEGQ